MGSPAGLVQASWRWVPRSLIEQDSASCRRACVEWKIGGEVAARAIRLVGKRRSTLEKEDDDMLETRLVRGTELPQGNR